MESEEWFSMNYSEIQPSEQSLGDNEEAEGDDNEEVNNEEGGEEVYNDQKVNNDEEVNNGDHETAQVEPITSATSVELPRKSTRERKEPDRLVVKPKKQVLYCALKSGRTQKHE